MDEKGTTITRFFDRHPKLRQFVCQHETSTDIGTLVCWNGNKWLVSQCVYCGLLIVNGKRYRLPGEIKCK